MGTRSQDLISAAVFLAAAAAMAWESSSELYSQAGASIAHDPVFYPRILLVAVAILAVSLIVSALRRKYEPVPIVSLRWRAAGTLMVAATLYVAAMPWLGFV
ncbi:MAG: tripartite tricarboxylate transporter TctB family protein, partial [Burkholderiaceae bacterium]|nr:tripartite tricarboxylate transporter TctB family protein [Burkholderiaceae bacterium]